MTPDAARARLAALGLRSLPKILTLMDRNRHSPTYGCFDRNFWHLRITDFPSGMSQEFVLPLALAYAHPFDGNRLHQVPVVKQWVGAGIDYAARSAHPDGSCDDYYPFEKAAGAAAFSLYAMIEAIRLAGLDAEPYLDFLKRRAEWLGHHQESGRLSNHEALIANCLFKMADMTGEARFSEMGRARMERLLGWQAEEGWFYEYFACDPGYLTLTIGNMAEMLDARPDLPLLEPIRRAVDFLEDLQPPDGWLGGEWTSRNTHNYFPHGFELIGNQLPSALRMNDRAIEAQVGDHDIGAEAQLVERLDERQAVGDMHLIDEGPRQGEAYPVRALHPAAVIGPGRALEAGVHRQQMRNGDVVEPRIGAGR